MPTQNINTADYWNRVYSQEWESGRVQGDCYHRDYGPIHDAIVELIPEGSSVLDIACGAGVLCRKIKKSRPAAQVMGVDFSEFMIARNRERDEPLGIDYRCVDIRSALSGIGGQFDVVAMCEILEHLDEPERVVRTALDLLKPGGLFVLSCPHDNSIPDHEHVRVWGHDDLFHLLAPYTRAVTFMHFDPPYFHLWMLAYLTKTKSGTANGSP
ncbi:MAG TPA: class I SAM-dependent methyltransferase [Candidatus Limnocylindrales bacterium]|jgi:2-polyprenyl-3-methyl-5-hydroxy-6-metoxy-1,4-benzoquinol methylase|nr:class I SAM-dependent methyltransferase [Candidatus Limnocylindrales bacterium]